MGARGARRIRARAGTERGIGHEIIGIVMGVGPVLRRVAVALSQLLDANFILISHLRSGNPSRGLATRIT
jgi:hypothetical protein